MKQTTYWYGDEAEYTGKTQTLHGGLFYEIKIIEGRRTGELKWTQTAPKGNMRANAKGTYSGTRGHSANASRSEPDETAARELSLFIENDYALVGAPNSKGKAIEKNLLAKLKSGRFNLALSEKAWMYLMEDDAKKYSKEFSDGRDGLTMFNKATRELVAHEFATTFYEEHKATGRALPERGGLSRNGSVDDGDYIVQGMYSDGSICIEFGFDDEAKAVSEARKLLKVHGTTWFEGDRVRVITRDGELVYS